jgi:triacylglycerol esterase/lipase EstA (alpha/beta hydrolase family)
VVDTLTHAYLRFHGFDFYRGSITHSISVIPPRPQAFIAPRRSPGYDISYWYHPHTSQKELPIVFFHGIGVGLYQYMQLLKEVNQGRRDEDGKIGILAVEILAISSRITTRVLRKEDMCQQLRSILRHHGFEKFVIVSHSLVSLPSG